MRNLIIIGAGGHGKVVADIAVCCGYSNIAFLDDNDSINYCMDFPIIGKSIDAKKYVDYDFVVAVGNAKVREKLLLYLTENRLNIPAMIHPKAVIARDVIIGNGTVIMAGAVINSGSRIGAGCIVNTGATIDHDNIIEDFVHVSVGCHLAGTVMVGKFTWIGIGAIVSNDIQICENCMLGAGAVVVKNIDEEGTYIGVPAQKIENSCR